MKKQYLVFLVSFLGLHCGDHKLEEVELEPADDRFQLVYSPIEKIFDDSGIYFRSKLIADPKKQEMKLTLVAHNPTKDEKVINLSNWEIITPNKLRRTAKLDSTSVKLKAGDAIPFSVNFRPINDLKIYKLSGYHGDLYKEYSIKFGNKTVTYKLSEHHQITYEKYLQNDKMSFFSFKNSKEEGEKNEIQRNGLTLNFKFYAIGDSIYGKMHMINHGEEDLVILPGKIFLNYNSTVFKPDHSSYKNEAQNNDTLVLPKGKRFWENASFRITQLPDSFTLLTNGILNDKSEPFVLSQRLYKVQ